MTFRDPQLSTGGVWLAGNAGEPVIVSCVGREPVIVLRGGLRGARVPATRDRVRGLCGAHAAVRGGDPGRPPAPGGHVVPESCNLSPGPARACVSVLSAVAMRADPIVA